MDITVADARLRNRRMQQLAARLGDLYGEIERLALSIHRWQRQIDHIDIYVSARQDWITQAQQQIDELKSRAEVLEATYYSLNGEG